MSPSATLGGESAAGTVNGAQKPAQSPELGVGAVPIPKVSDPWTVDKVLAASSSTRPAEGSSSPIPYFHLLERLKTTKREGWRRFDIQR